MSTTTIWAVSIAAQAIAGIIGGLSRSVYRKVCVFVWFLLIDAFTSVALFRLNDGGHHVAYLWAWRAKQILVVLPLSLLVISEAIHNMHMRSLKRLWMSAIAAVVLGIVAHRQALWPDSAQELIFSFEGTLNAGLMFMLLFSLASENASRFARSHAVLLCCYFGMNAFGYFGASLYFPTAGTAMVLGSVICWMAWIGLFLTALMGASAVQ